MLNGKGDLADLAGLKLKIDKLDICKFESTLVDLSKESDVANMKSLKQLNIVH